MIRKTVFGCYTTKRAIAETGISLSVSVEEAICFGWIDGKLRRVDENSFIVRFSPRKTHSVWSKINRDRAEKLIETKRMTMAGMDAVLKAQKSGSRETPTRIRSKIHYRAILRKP